MSTAGIASTSIYQEIQSFFQTRSSDLSQLGNALQSGDLSDAQQAYQSIVTLGQGGPFAGGDPFRNSQREQDFNAIGTALQSGDLSGAQQAFSQLESTFQTGGLSSQNNSTASSSQTGPAVVINLTFGASTTSSTTSSSTTSNSNSSTSSTSSSSSSTATGPTNPIATQEIVINLNGNGSTPEEVTLDFNNTGNGEQLTISASEGNQTTPEVTLNLNQNSNEQIILNLLNSAASTSSTAQTSGVSVVA